MMEQSPYPAGLWFVLLLILLLLVARMCMGFCSCTGGGSAVNVNTISKQKKDACSRNLAYTQAYWTVV